MQKWIVEHEKEIAEALDKDLGKPFMESYLAEIQFILSEIHLVKKKLSSWMKAKKVSTNLLNLPGKSEIISEPYGVVLIFSAWNYPFQLMMAPWIAAVAAGNVTVLKPSELSPHTAQLIEKMVKDIGGEAALVIQGGADRAQQILEERFDYIFYTGSTLVGQKVMEAAAKYITPLTLELGGKSPCIVDRDVDIEESARRLVSGKFFNAGQSCVAPDYILVPREDLSTWTQVLEETIQQFYGTDPSNSPDYTRIISDRHMTRLQKLSEHPQAMQIGHPQVQQRKMAPVIVPNISWDEPLMKEEIFGPILPIIAYDSMEEVFDKIESREKPLALYVFSKKKSFADQVIARLSSGSVCVNHVILQITNPNLPFGGVGHSGMGRYHGYFGFETFSHQKSVMRKPHSFNPITAYPPYEKKEFLPKLLKKFQAFF